ncbi:MAG TPA: hypothetical protein VK131_05610 [Candidatus Acidoferrales bacterium]|nr:hypothetical protein [Candidatus Acidoferrales bacterium]
MSRGDQVLRTAAGACLAGGALAFLALAATGRPGQGLALATGLGIGALNGFLARRALGLGVSFGVTSFARLALLSALGVAVALVLYPAVAWLVLLGMGAAQLTLTGVALRAALRG